MTPSMRNFDVHHIDALSVDTMVEKFLGIFFYGILTTLDTGQSSGIFTEYQGNIVEHFLGNHSIHLYTYHLPIVLMIAGRYSGSAYKFLTNSWYKGI